MAMLFSALNLQKPQVMGILNVTPDSFSDGDRYTNITTALRHAEAMQAAGASLIDIGGESTRPGSVAVTAQQELDRVIPVIEAVQARIEVAISIDTSKPIVMREAVQAGASLINDVNALQAEQALETAVQLGVPVCLMHKQGEPGTMQQKPHYDDVVAEVRAYLMARATLLQQAGMAVDQILLDPGFGFGKTLDHNLDLLRQLNTFTGYPILVGLSRKTMLGTLTGRPIKERVAASVAAATIALQQGANILRVHDVAETVDAVTLWTAINKE